MQLIIFAIIGFILTSAGIKIFLQWLHKREIFDIPNERSSHQNPTPVGGGIVIACVTLVLFFIYMIFNSETIVWSYFAGSLIIAVISWLDDVYSVSAVIRFFCHSLAAILIILGLGVYESFYIPLIGNINLGIFSYVFWFLWIVWLINAYNFMDGIDGIAGIQALTASVFWIFIAAFLGNNLIIAICGIIAASSFAFLIFNWQPAKIFMGDVGSAFLGYTFAVVPLFFLMKKTEQINILPVAGILLVWMFVFDSVRTFLLRLLQGEPVWKAHRRHIYQQFVIKGWKHSSVSLIYGILSAIISGIVLFWVNDYSNFNLILTVFVIITSSGISLFSHFTKLKELKS